METLKWILLGNSSQDWLTALLIFCLTFLIFILLRRTLVRRFQSIAADKENDVDLFIADLLKKTKPAVIFFLALYLGSLVLTLQGDILEFLRTATIVVVILQFAFWGVSVIDFAVKRRIKAEPEEEAVNATTLGALSMVIKIALWSVVILLILENITGMEMSALVAALGVGGIAIALAVQNILGDLFSSVSIALDKPFVIGDIISVGEFSGTVEHIGLKSTRIRSLTGEQIVFSNSDLLSSRVRNLSCMQRRRVSFIIGVDANTPYQKLEGIPDILQEIVQGNDQVTFDRACLREIGDYALNFEVIYFVEVPEVRAHVDLQHVINMAVLKRFGEEGIEMPYPTQKILVKK